MDHTDHYLLTNELEHYKKNKYVLYLPDFL